MFFNTWTKKRLLGEGAEHSVKEPGQQEEDEDKRTATSARVAVKYEKESLRPTRAPRLR